MQILIIAGNVGKDAELRTTQSGEKVLGFTLAVDNGKAKDGSKREPTWFDCAIWGKRAESLNGYIKKGSKLTLQGRPSARSHDGKAYLQIIVNELTFMSSAQRDEGSRDDGGYPSSASRKDFDDEIPF